MLDQKKQKSNITFTVHDDYHHTFCYQVLVVLHYTCNADDPLDGNIHVWSSTL